MPDNYTPTRPPAATSTELLATQEWVERELSNLLLALVDTKTLELRTTFREPIRPREGMIVHADGTVWNPGSGIGPYIYSSGTWTPLDQSAVAGSLLYYENITDGSVTATAAVGGDTVKFRQTAGLTVAVQSNDVTHGDNVLYGLDLNALTVETAVAVGDTFPFTDVSASNVNRKITWQNFLNGINLLTEDTAPDGAADFLVSYDTSATAAKKIKPDLLRKGEIAAIFADVKTLGTEGGTFTSGANQIRVLNTEVYDPTAAFSVATNQITVPAGTWEIEWWAPAHEVAQHQSFLFNVTGAVEVARGGSARASANTTTLSMGRTVVTPGSATAYEVRHRCTSTKADNGFGTAASFGSEVYTMVVIRRA